MTQRSSSDRSSIAWQLFDQPSEPWKPHGYQRKAVKWLLEHAAGALFLDPGLGKTSVTLAALKFLRARGLIEKVLLIAPLRVCHSVWPKEMRKWDDFLEMRCTVLHGPHKEELLHDPLGEIFVINPDGLPWLLGVTRTPTPSGKKVHVEVDMKRWKKLGFDTLVIDELSKFKHAGTQRFKALKQVVPTFGRRWGLTGSPAPNGLIDLFGQCYVIDEGRSLGKYVTHFRSKYFTPNGPPSEPGKAPKPAFGWALQEGADKKIFKRLKPLALRMAAEDYLDMPKLIENVVRVDLPADAQRVHDQLEEDLIAKIKRGVVVAANAAAASMKCRQVANGAVYIDDDGGKKRRWRAVHDEKLEAVADLIDELQGEPLLVAYDFQHDLERLLQRLGKKTPFIGGGVTTQRAAALERAWNLGELPVLLGHPQSLAHGLNLQGAGRHVCWHSLTWNYELYDQFNRRVWRQGQKAESVFVHHIVAASTIDEAVLGALRSKRRGQQALFDALRTRARAKR